MAQVQTESIREAAAERRTEAEERFAAATAELDRIGENFNNFATNLRDIRTFLDNDLNPAGVEALGGAIDDAKTQAETAVEDIQTIVAALDGIANSLANTAPEPDRN